MTEIKEEPKKVKKEEPKEVKKEKKPRKSRKKKSKKVVIITRGKRKKAVARANIRKGKGKVRVNNILVEAYNNKYVRDLVLEPVKIVGPAALEVDISVRVYGGGTLGQAQAARTAIAKALVEYLKDDKIKALLYEKDRSLLVDDSRRIEPKKYRGPKARARFQKSYR